MEFFSGFQPADFWFLTQAAGRTLLIAALSISLGTLIGMICGWLLSISGWAGMVFLNPVLDVFRSVPLLIQLVLFFNLFPIIGLPLSPFVAGIIILTVYTAALVANVARAGIDAVDPGLRHAARSLGMTYWQDMRHVVWPVGLRAVFPSWVGVAVGVLKDSALVSVLGYVELLRASQILVTRTQEPFLILTIAGAFYFALSYPISHYAMALEKRWAQ